jgi:3-methyl-2-oxobutanoate hydroxymethyltransferase
MSTTSTIEAGARAADPARPPKRLTVPMLRTRKGPDAEPLVMLTAYTARMAQLLDPHCDMLLVGDSLAQVIYGLPSTVPVTLEMMAAHGAAVVRGSSHALVAIDMPFGSYEASPAQAFENAARLLKETGAAAVKLEGGEAMAPAVRFLTERGIPVIGHIGLTPQAVNTLGGYGARGRSEAEAAKIVSDGIAIAQAGAFSIVIEGVLEPIAIEVTNRVTCPTIGIGGSARCDGQVLVGEDMLGLFDQTARFVKRYEDLAGRISAAVAAYSGEVRSRAFPGAEHLYQPRA